MFPPINAMSPHPGHRVSSISDTALKKEIKKVVENVLHNQSKENVTK